MIKGTPKSACVENRGFTRLCDIGYTNLIIYPSYNQVRCDLKGELFI